jgi:hypothetical protein
VDFGAGIKNYLLWIMALWPRRISAAYSPLSSKLPPLHTVQAMRKRLLGMPLLGERLCLGSAEHMNASGLVVQVHVVK